MHSCIGALVLTVASILATGYALSCQNLCLSVEPLGTTSITCRSLLLDPNNHFELKKNHRNNDFYSQYHGYCNFDQDLSDFEIFQNIAFTDNLRIECALAGALGKFRFMAPVILQR